MDIVCNLDITNKECVHYIQKIRPNTFYAFPIKYVYNVLFNVTRFNIMHNPTDEFVLTYHYLVNGITTSNDIIYIKQDTTGTLSNMRVMQTSTFDLLTSYFIYKKRISCCSLIPNYAKNKTLKLLDTRYKTITNNYISLLSWYLYLRANLTQFPYELPPHNYFNITVHINDDIDMDILTELKQNCDTLHHVLLEYINKL